MVVVIKLKLRKGQLSAALKRLAKTRRKGASVLRFVGKIPFEGDPVETQKAMRRDRE
jgi:hypothetical protein